MKKLILSVLVVVILITPAAVAFGDIERLETGVGPWELYGPVFDAMVILGGVTIVFGLVNFGRGNSTTGILLALGGYVVATAGLMLRAYK